jgi:hypothetical protein
MSSAPLPPSQYWSTLQITASLTEKKQGVPFETMIFVPNTADIGCRFEAKCKVRRYLYFYYEWEGVLRKMRKKERWTEVYGQISALLSGERKSSRSYGFEDTEYGHLEPCGVAACGGRPRVLER